MFKIQINYKSDSYKYGACFEKFYLPLQTNVYVNTVVFILTELSLVFPFMSWWAAEYISYVYIFV